MKILIAGLGSIGQRHARNLRALLGDEVEILAHRVRGLPHVITERMTIDAGTTVEARYGIRSFDRLEAALAERPDAAIVCNPTSAHLATAAAAVRAGCDVLIEKPLADSYDGVDELIELADARRVVAAVGYQLRFHPALLRMRELLCHQTIGEVTGVRAEWGEYLPDAHPYEDYRHSYAARRDLGGGVILCFIHELDYLSWLFGAPRRVHATGGRLGDLEIDVEDTAHLIMAHAIGTRIVPVELRLSFADRTRARTCVVAGERGTIHLDLNQPSLRVADRDGRAIEARQYDGFERNQLFLDELKHFLLAIDGRQPPSAPIREAAQSLRTALAARESLAAGRAVELS